MTDTRPTQRGHTTTSRNRNSIVCSICQAVYAPAQGYDYLLHAPRVALESTFMSMCHFCFRCRRAACPNCWDYIHGVCGDCALEANLHFRTHTTPLHGVLFPPTRRAQLRRRRMQQPRLVCIRPGRFQHAAPIDAAETLTMQSVASPLPPSPTLAMTDEAPTQPPSPPAPPEVVRTSTPRPPSLSGVHIDEIPTKPERRHAAIIHIERLITALLFFLLVLVLLLVGIASASQDANTIILHLTHIDIRAEIAYIFRLLRQLFA